MRKKILATMLLGASVLSSVCFGSNTLLYGVVGESASSDVLKQFRKNEIHTLQTALNKPVELKIFSTHSDELRAIQKDPNLLTFMYGKPVIMPAISKINNWKKIAQVSSMDPVTHRLSNTYSAYLIAAKNSTISKPSDLSNKTLAYYNTESTSNYIAIKKLLSDNKVTNVHWVKAKNLNQAYTMIESGKADAVGTWHYYFHSHKHKDNFKIIYKINHLSNPVLYVNTNNLSTKEIQKVKIALRQMRSKTTANFTYK